MKNILTIREEEIFKGKSKKLKISKLRKATRAIVFDNSDKVALLKVSSEGYYKLPGGGVERGESLKQALRRECLEEIGCEITIIKELGKITEFRNSFGLKQESFCYLARLHGKKGKTAFTEKERANGFKVVWVNLGKAVKLLREAKPKEYIGKFIVARDLKFIETAKTK